MRELTPPDSVRELTPPDSVRELTPPGAGGVAVLEVRGAAASERVRALIGGALPAPGEVRFVRFVDGRGTESAEVLDEGLVVGAPDSGALELHLHGSRAVVESVRARVGGGAPELDLPARLRRAAAAAPTALGARLVLAQVEGAHLADALRRVVDVAPEVAPALARALLDRAASYAPLLRPSLVVLAGPVNAGKSTLLNALAGTEVALTSDRAGTTRDTVTADAALGGWPFLLVDTAGERDAAGRGAVEREGQALAREVAARADAVLRLVPADVLSPDAAPQGGAPSARLRTRAAEVLGDDPDLWPADHVSALEDPAHAARRVGEVLGEVLGLADLAPLAAALDRGEAPPVPLDARLTRALEAYRDAPSDRSRQALLDSAAGLL